MAQFTYPASATAQQITVGEDPGTHTGADRDNENIVVPPSLAVQGLCHRQRVHVVLDEHRQRELPAQHLADRNALPAQLCRVDRADVLVIHRAGDPDPHPQERRGTCAAGDEGCEEVSEASDRGAGGGIEGFGRRADDSAVDACLHHRDMIGDDLDADGTTGVGDEAQQSCRATAL